jgi:hypothetical protein
MADWPELAELKQVLNVDSSAWDGDSDNTRLTRLLASAIDLTKAHIAGTADAYDVLYTDPTDRHAQAALRMAELLAERSTTDTTVRVNTIVREDPTLNRLLFGQRQRFGVA